MKLKWVDDSHFLPSNIPFVMSNLKSELKSCSMCGLVGGWGTLWSLDTAVIDIRHLTYSETLNVNPRDDILARSFSSCVCRNSMACKGAELDFLHVT